MTNAEAILTIAQAITEAACIALADEDDDAPLYGDLDDYIDTAIAEMRSGFK